MRKEFLTDGERAFLEEHLTDVIGLFEEACWEIKEELKDIVKRKGSFDSYTSENRFLKWDISSIFTCGYCFYFARIMKSVFPESQIVFEFTGSKRTHSLLRINDIYFDVYMLKQENEIKFNKYKDADIKDLEYARKKFKQMNQDLYEKLKYKFYRNIKEYLNKNYKLKTYVKNKMVMKGA